MYAKFRGYDFDTEEETETDLQFDTVEELLHNLPNPDNYDKEDYRGSFINVYTGPNKDDKFIGMIELGEDTDFDLESVITGILIGSHLKNDPNWECQYCGLFDEDGNRIDS